MILCFAHCSVMSAGNAYMDILLYVRGFLNQVVYGTSEGVIVASCSQLDKEPWD